MSQLQGSAIVSGGASGLGRACVERLHADGLAVLIADVNDDAGDELAGSLGERVVYRHTDVTDADSVQAAATQAAGLDPAGLRVSIGCAGIGRAERLLGKRGPHSVELFRTVIDVNLVGMFQLLRAAAAVMSENEPLDGGRGVHISTASVAAFEGQVGQVAYSASKGAIVAMTIAAARDLSQFGIRVCTIAPGLFLTPMMMELPEEVQESLGKSVPFPQRLGRPEEFADLALAIVRNPMLNGETVRLDGALRLAPR
ncbi:MAG: SDR family NAD(P)-dependent oxidoreductase [Solirubrobacteraceae bacterium]